jgi:hypothetical protein
MYLLTPRPIPFSSAKEVLSGDLSPFNSFDDKSVHISSISLFHLASQSS